MERLNFSFIIDLWFDSIAIWEHDLRDVNSFSIFWDLFCGLGES